MDRFTNLDIKTILWIVGGILAFWFLQTNVPTFIPDLFGIMSGCVGAFTEIDIPAGP